MQHLICIASASILCSETPEDEFSQFKYREDMDQSHVEQFGKHRWRKAGPDFVLPSLRYVPSSFRHD